MKIIKLGGSLTHSETLVRCMETINQHYQQQPVVIVPGGGMFADQVRMQQQHWQFNDKAAHQMAILAMQQTAIMLQALQPEWQLLTSLITPVDFKAAITLWMPQLDDLDCPEIPANWSVTSDSLAAWLAGRLDANELILVKAATIDENSDVFQLQQQGVVDAAFHLFTLRARFRITVINSHRFSCLHC